MSTQGFILHSNPQNSYANSKDFSASINLLTWDVITWNLEMKQD